MEWFNPPPEWRAEDDKIYVTSAPKTDFWRKQPEGPYADNGHFYFQKAAGDFIADVRFTGQFREQYDQAGLMIRLDEANWVKCGIEFYNEVPHVSVVVTKTYSDWSIQPLPAAPDDFWLRVTREGAIIEVFYSTDGHEYHLIRQAYLTSEPLLAIGIMAAAPLGSGFPVVFAGFRLKAPSQSS